jgi:hypothetical protein
MVRNFQQRKTRLPRPSLVSIEHRSLRFELDDQGDEEKEGESRTSTARARRGSTHVLKVG